MSQKIEDVLQVLAGIRDGYRKDKPESLRRVRIRVVRQIAEQRGVDYQTIADAYIRRLAPDIKRTPAFDRLVEEWLASDSPSLRRILERHVLDRGDPARIHQFFTSGARLTMRSSRNCIATPGTWHKELAMCRATRCNSA